MAKKDFSAASTGRVYQQISDATAEPETQEAQRYTDAEAQEAKLQMKTQGKKGLKAARINMAFAPDTYDYIRIMAQAKGISITEFVNQLIRQHMEEPGNLEAYPDTSAHSQVASAKLRKSYDATAYLFVQAYRVLPSV